MFSNFVDAGSQQETTMNAWLSDNNKPMGVWGYGG